MSTTRTLGHDDLKSCSAIPEEHLPKNGSMTGLRGQHDHENLKETYAPCLICP